jgi:hypothetical protein
MKDVGQFAGRRLLQLVYPYVHTSTERLSPIEQASLVNSLKLWWMVSIGSLPYSRKSKDLHRSNKDNVWDLWHDTGARKLHRELYDALSTMFRLEENQEIKLFTGFALLANEMGFHMWHRYLNEGSACDTYECHLSSFMRNNLVELTLALFSRPLDDNPRRYALYLWRLTFGRFHYDDHKTVEHTDFHDACRSACLALRLVESVELGAMQRDQTASQSDDFEFFFQYYKDAINDNLALPTQKSAEVITDGLFARREEFPVVSSRIRNFKPN